MNDKPTSIRADSLADALRHLETAMELLDSHGAPAQIAAYVDLAACQLRDVIGSEIQTPNITPPLT